jgi:[1-hydroxy-2-(trimethylamino)ethyl]phosphonate dioxygenase
MNRLNQHSIVDQIIDLFENHGGSLYFGEQVTETEHALQAAHLAEKSGASPEMIAGALLHDIGHLLHGLGEDIAEHGVDGKHEDIGAQWLEGHFPAKVLDCIRLHVDAKRYLTATEPGYLEDLSEASKRSLELQGGPFTSTEVMEFEARESNYKAAIQVRRWDDEAKIVGLKVPPASHYKSLLESLLIG